MFCELMNENSELFSPNYLKCDMIVAKSTYRSSVPDTHLMSISMKVSTKLEP